MINDKLEIVRNNKDALAASKKLYEIQKLHRTILTITEI